MKLHQCVHGLGPCARCGIGPEFDAALRYDQAMTALALSNQRNAQLRAEIIRHGWELDCTRCAALIDGEEIPEAGCDCSCHDTIQPGLVPCPICAGHSSRSVRTEEGS